MNFKNMATAKKNDLGMTNFDELFMTDAERKEVKLPRIYDIPIAEIDDFPNHPYEVRDDEDMQFLVENVKERVIIPRRAGKNGYAKLYCRSA